MAFLLSEGFDLFTVHIAPLRWKKYKGQRFPYGLTSNRDLHKGEYLEMLEWCSETFGKRGRIPDPTDQWCALSNTVYPGGSMILQDICFEFVSKNDELLFYLKYTYG